jgi:galactokinase
VRRRARNSTPGTTFALHRDVAPDQAVPSRELESRHTRCTATFSVFAPARINLIGEHTDYSGGLVLPVAIDLGVTVTGAPADRVIRLRSDAFRDTAEMKPDGTGAESLTGWGRYVAAVARLLDDRGRQPVGFEGTITSTVPVGAGLSSSAALDVSVGLALCRAAGFAVPPLELARLARRAEELAVGVPCGLMDPAASLLGRAGHALLLDCGSETYRAVRLPEELAIVVLDSGVRHALEHSGYAVRRTQLTRAIEALNGREPARLTPSQATALAQAGGADEVSVRRLRHVVSENDRVRACVAALEDPAGPDLDRLGELFWAGHESLRDDFEVSTSELDLLVELAYAEGATAARMTGGGFGGSVVALVERSRAATFAESVAATYSARTGRDGQGFVCHAVNGASERSADQ